MLLFLDDERMPQDVYWISGLSTYQGDILIARNFSEFVEKLASLSNEQKNQLWISLDHDLADFHNEENCPYPEYMIKGRRGVELTGASVLSYVIDKIQSGGIPLNITLSVHSQNPIASENMRNKWESFQKFAQRYLK